MSKSIDDGGPAGTGLERQPDYAVASSAAPSEQRLKEAAKVVLDSRQQLDVLLKTQLRSPTADTSLALALLKRWNVWFGGGDSRSAQDFGRELAVSWQTNSRTLLEMLKSDSQRNALRTLLNAVANAVAENPVVSASQLISSLPRPRRSVAVPQDSHPRLDIEGWLDDDLDTTLDLGGTGAPTAAASASTAPLGSLRGARGASPASRTKIPLRKGGGRQASTPLERRGRTTSPKRQNSPRRRIQMVPDESVARSGSRPSLAVDYRKRAHSKSRPKAYVRPKQVVHTKSFVKSHERDDQVNWDKKEEFKYTPKKPVTGPAPPMPDEEKKLEEHDRVHEEMIKKQAAMASVGRYDVRNNQRYVWDETLQKKKVENDKNRRKHIRNEKRIEATHQLKTQVIQLVARINYALHQHTRVVHGIKVKDMKSFFEAMDVDGSGAISREELEQGLFELRVNLTPDAVHLLMGELDRDFSGTLEYSEFMKWWEQAEVVQAAMKAMEEKRFMENAENSMQRYQCRSMRAAPSSVVAQLNFVLNASRTSKSHRTLNGKPVTDSRSFFHAIDTDETGSLHPVEIQQGLRRIDVTMTEGDIQALVDVVDQDANGRMDILEVMAWADFQLVGAAVAMQVRQVFDEKRTLYGYPVTDAASLFEAIDVDGSGILEFEELVNGLRRLQLKVGYPEIDALLGTLGRDRTGGFDKEELIWLLDQKSQMGRVRKAPTLSAEAKNEQSDFEVGKMAHQI
jgi:Ca2+-binding EF-hand superfamily protein